MTGKIIFVKTESSESRKMEEKLINLGVEYTEIYVKTDAQPQLITGTEVVIHIGSNDIGAYLDTLPRVKQVRKRKSAKKKK